MVTSSGPSSSAFGWPPLPPQEAAEDFIDTDADIHDISTADGNRVPFSARVLVTASATQAVPDKVCTPKGYGSASEPELQPVTIEMMVTTLLAAKRARGKSRKVLRVPRRPSAELFHNKGKRTSTQIGARVLGHLDSLALRALQDLDTAGHPSPTPQVLADALEEYAWRTLRSLVIYPAPGEPSPTKFEKWARVTPERLDELCHAAAVAALGWWDPDFIRRRREWGRKGGRRSRRGPTWTQGHLDALQGLEACSVDEQAAVLGYSRRTILRMRAVLRVQGVHGDDRVRAVDDATRAC